MPKRLLLSRTRFYSGPDVKEEPLKFRFYQPLFDYRFFTTEITVIPFPLLCDAIT